MAAFVFAVPQWFGLDEPRSHEADGGALVSWIPAEPSVLVMLSVIRFVKIEPSTAAPSEPERRRAGRDTRLG